MTKRLATFVPVSCLLLGLAVPALHAAVPELPAGVTRGPSVEGIDEYRLANGLEVLLFPDDTRPIVTVNVTYRVGSRNENYGETGMAHLLEHLMFKGSPKHTDIMQELTTHGARPNGTTSYDRTNYYETSAATDENLEWALDLEADRMVNSFIAKKDLDSEMTVVRNEFESGENDPFSVLLKHVMGAAYEWHNYGKPTIGARADIENVPIERLQAFYRTWYQPDNAVLVLAGSFDPAKALALVARKFGPLPKPARALPRTYTAEPVQDGEREVTLRRVGDTQDLLVAYHTPAVSHPDAPALGILAYVLGDTPSGRLHKALVETKKAAAVFSFSWHLADPTLLMAGAELRQESSLAEARAALLGVLEGAGAAPVTEAEVERARTALLNDIELALRSPERVGITLSEWLVPGDWRLYFWYRDQLKTVTSADVTRVAAQYLKPANRTLGQFVPTAKPDRAAVPAAPDVAALLKDYRGGAAVAAGETIDPAPDALEKRTRRGATGGLRFALLPKATRGHSVNVSMALDFGSLDTLKGRATVGELTGSMLMRGTAKHTRQEIQDGFDRLKTQVSIGGGATGAFVSLTTDREHLAAALRLAAEVLREPAFPEKELETLRQEQLAGLEQQRTEPESLARIEFDRTLNPFPEGDVRYRPRIEEAIADTRAVTVDAVRAFWRDFYGAGSGEIGAVGDFDPGAFEALVKELFGGWTAKTPRKRVPSERREVAAKRIAIETPDKQNALFVAGLTLAVRDDDPDYPALDIANFMTGGGFLNSRLATRIRRTDGLSYGVGSTLFADSEDPYALFMTYAIMAPQNADRVETAFREEIARIAEKGFTADELLEAKAGWLKRRAVNRSMDAGLAAMLQRQSYLGRTMAWTLDYEKKVQALTPEQVTAAFRKHIVLDRMVMVRAGDFAGAKDKAK